MIKIGKISTIYQTVGTSYHHVDQKQFDIFAIEICAVDSDNHR